MQSFRAIVNSVSIDPDDIIEVLKKIPKTINDRDGLYIGVLKEGAIPSQFNPATFSPSP